MVIRSLYLCLFALLTLSSCESPTPVEYEFNDDQIVGDTILVNDHWSVRAPLGVKDLSGIKLFVGSVPVQLQALRFGRIFFKAPSVPESGIVRVYLYNERVPSDINHLVVELHQNGPHAIAFMLETKSGSAGGRLVITSHYDTLDPGLLKAYCGEVELPIDTFMTPNFLQGSTLLVDHVSAAGSAEIAVLYRKGLYPLGSYSVIDVGARLSELKATRLVGINGRIFGQWRESSVFDPVGKVIRTSYSVGTILWLDPTTLEWIGDSLIFEHKTSYEQLTMRLYEHRSTGEISGTVYGQFTGDTSTAKHFSFSIDRISCVKRIDTTFTQYKLEAKVGVFPRIVHNMDAHFREYLRIFDLISPEAESKMSIWFVKPE